jgi:hypothetical protein
LKINAENVALNDYLREISKNLDFPPIFSKIILTEAKNRCKAPLIAGFIIRADAIRMHVVFEISFFERIYKKIFFLIAVFGEYVKPILFLTLVVPVLSLK